ncbi:putative circularly permuted ATP-grasp superfamily protein/putative alpha-E superfamily protein [Mycobacterium frederiksbergense]|uniref:Circularly permuted ATP-grasp superfamily protein/putative alpha-E superfamily protein n=1 Tax=Mycolicibacterium frederiksbergense TaxID=117567 RepID=A0ABT6KSF7_9MYCO|nr:circularly permuted type 2 ATP-grasp protein [Mycolicibacterium frederiksbergense]MDH6193678.1 putative circularly permuted ATP-grasp superfamily protein/putative alpha-E superfamily protein [Mycolicibacterium frederiksbergense]
MVPRADGSPEPALVAGAAANTVVSTVDGRDVDGMLAAYRGSRAQQALFDVREAAGAAAGYDELVDASGDVRPAWRELAECIGERGADGLDQLSAVVRGLVDNDGITYIQVDRHGKAATADNGAAVPGPWHLDALPLVISAEDWDPLESGLVQRSRLLDAVLTDLYGARRSITSGVLPAPLLFAHPGYLRAARGIAVPGRHQLFMHGCDISRGDDGAFVVNADWTQAPSGAGYALADRRVIAHAAPDVYERISPRPASPWAQALRLALLDAAPQAAEEPVVVVLSPGIHSETAFDQAYLAGVLGFPLVESVDLVVRDGTLWMRSLGTLKRVDVVLRRVDADYADPLDLRPDSRLGVVGLVEVLRRGAVTVVNTLGSGILESPGLARFLPQLADLLLDEAPRLAAAQMYWGGIDIERSHLLTKLSELLIRPVTGGESIVGPMLSAADRDDLAARIEADPWQWMGQELPQFSTAPTHYGVSGLSAGNVGMRLFTVAQRGGYAPMIGGLGYLVAPGNSAYRMNTIAAKDVWVRTPKRVTAERIPTVAVELIAPEMIPSPTRAVSSPRVLADLFWIGRYAERAEGMARLLTVTRERYHEFRYRPDLEESQCVPVLLAAIGSITGTDTGGTDDDHEMIATAPTTLWSVTADRHRAGSLAESVEHLELAARAVRDQMSNDTWMVLAGVEHAVLLPSAAQPESPTAAEAYLANAHSQTLAGMLALSGVAAESMVQDIGWTMMDIGKRIERGLALTALLRATLTTTRGVEAERAVTESTLVACESSVIYRRRNPGRISIAAIAELVLFDAENPRSLIYQLERIRTGLKTLPGSSGSSRSERLVDELATRLRRLDPADLEEVTPDGRRAELAGLLDGIHVGLRDLSGAITAAHLTLPTGMQPLWGPDERRVMP